MAAAAVSTAASACFAGLFVFHDFSHDQPHYTEQDQQNQDCSSIHIHFRAGQEALMPSLPSLFSFLCSMYLLFPYTV